MCVRVCVCAWPLSINYVNNKNKRKQKSHSRNSQEPYIIFCSDYFPICLSTIVCTLFSFIFFFIILTYILLILIIRAPHISTYRTWFCFFGIIFFILYYSSLSYSDHLRNLNEKKIVLFYLFIENNRYAFFRCCFFFFFFFSMAFYLSWAHTTHMISGRQHFQR